MKRRIAEVVTLLLLSILFGLTPFIVQASPTATFYVDPPSIGGPSYPPGSSFTVSVNVLEAVDLYAWQINMIWDIAVLDAAEIAFGDFLSNQPQGSVQTSNINNEEGRLLVGEATIGAHPGVDGDGWLCSITFFVETSGETVLNIDTAFTYYLNSVSEIFGDDPGELVKESGYFNNVGSTIPATVEIFPDPLILSRKGGSITAYIELPEGYSVNNINIATVKMNCKIQAKPNPTKIGDYDNDGIPDLMVKFIKREVILLLTAGENALTITGEVGGEIFEGSDTITAI